MNQGCVFCTTDGGLVVWRDARCRVVIANEPFPGFCRVIWNEHVREMTDLSKPDRGHCLDVAFAVEASLRALLSPAKINLASLGNLVPHLHWHVIPRFADDSHFPQPVWGLRQRDPAPRGLPADFAATLGARIGRELASGAAR